MRILGVDVAHALSPEAKGKGERHYRWLQARVVITCVLEKLSTIEGVRLALKQELDRYNNYQVHSTTEEIPSIHFEKVREKGNSLFRPSALPKPYTSAKDIFCLREIRTVNGRRKISLFNHEIAVPNVPLQEEAKINLLLDVGKGVMEVRIGRDNQLI